MKVRAVRKYAKPYKSAKRFARAAAPHLHKVSATSTTMRNWPMANKTGGVFAKLVCAVCSYRHQANGGGHPVWLEQESS